MIRILLIIFSLAAVSGCSVLVPYEENFACRNKTKMGKCVTVEEAYKEARENGDYYAHFDEEGDKTEEEKQSSRKRGHHRSRHHKFPSQRGGIASKGKSSAEKSTDHPIHEVMGDSHTFYGYKNREYRELSGMIDKPVTPMIRKPKVLRTLIIPYKDKQGKSSILYMDRYVYSILEESEFVLGGYLNPSRGNAFITNKFYNEQAQ